MTPTLEESTTRLRNIIDGEAFHKVREAVSDYQYIVFTDHQGTKTLEIIKPPGETAAITIQKHPDGTLTKHTLMESPDDTLYEIGTKGATQDYQVRTYTTATLRTMIVRETLRLAGPILPNALADDSINQQLDSKATQLMNEITSRSTLPTWLGDRQNHHLPNEQILHNVMADPDVQILLKHFYPNTTTITVPLYNNMAQNIRVFKEMETVETNNLLHHYLDWSSEDTHHPIIQHPGQVTRILRKELGLTDHQWHIFTRIHHDSWVHIGQYTPAQIAQVCETIHLANPSSFPQHPVGSIIDLLSRDDTVLDQLWSHGKPIDAWANLTRRYLKLEDENQILSTNDPKAQTLSNIADALRDTITSDQPWGPGNWHILSQRSDRWHRQLKDQRAKEQEKALQERLNIRWESLIDEVTIGPHKFTALNTLRELDHIGAQMGNCIGRYEHSCTTGSTRIFQVDEDDIRIAAVELVQRNGAWTTGQAEAEEHRPPPSGLKQNHQELCRLYNLAFHQEQDTNGDQLP